MARRVKYNCGIYPAEIIKHIMIKLVLITELWTINAFLYFLNEKMMIPNQNNKSVIEN